MEQIAVVGCKMGECPQCTVPPKELGILDDYPLRNLENILAALAKYDSDPHDFVKACQEAGVKPIIHPFWEDLPYCNIHLSITVTVFYSLRYFSRLSARLGLGARVRRTRVKVRSASKRQAHQAHAPSGSGSLRTRGYEPFVSLSYLISM